MQVGVQVLSDHSSTDVFAENEALRSALGECWQRLKDLEVQGTGRNTKNLAKIWIKLSGFLQKSSKNHLKVHIFIGGTCCNYLSHTNLVAGCNDAGREGRLRFRRRLRFGQ